MADKKPSSSRRVARKVLHPIRSRIGIPQDDPIKTSRYRRIMTGKPGDSVCYGPECYDKDGLEPTSVRWSEKQGRFVDAPAPSNEKQRAKLSRIGKARQARAFNSPMTVGYRQGVRIPESARPPRRKVSGPFVVAKPSNPVTKVKDKSAMRPGSVEVGRRGPRPPQMIPVPLEDYKSGLGGRSAYPPRRPIPGSVSEFRRMSGTPQMRRAIGRGIGSMAAMMGAKAAGDYIASTPLGRAIRRSLVK